MTKLEQSLREKFGFTDNETKSPESVFQELGAFWWHWNLHKRKCDKTSKSIISVFSKDCPYPVWHKDVWIAEAEPPFLNCHPELDSGSSAMGTFDWDLPVMEQLWELWQQSPVPHNFQSHNQNCEYTDDWYRSKNCYMCHSGQNNQDCRYCYGCDQIKDCYWSIFSFGSELCADLINSKQCFNSFYLLNCRQVNDSSFLYDCRNCTDCMFSFNLRNKQYCFGNQQLSKEEYLKKKTEWDLKSADTYKRAQTHFADMMVSLAWHRAQMIDKSKDSAGNFLTNCRNTENCYMITDHEDCVNTLFSGPGGKSTLNSLGTVGGELTYMSVLPVYSYDVRFCFGINNTKFSDYCAFLHNCEYCFGCCGLVNKKYHIFNKPYSQEDYEALVPRIIEHMKKTGEWGEFFPSYFAPTPYAESLSGYYFPKDETHKERKPTPADKNETEFCEKLGIPINTKNYMDRIQENLKWLNWTGSLRTTTCGKSGKTIQTNWPEIYNGRILSEEEYLKLIA